MYGADGSGMQKYMQLQQDLSGVEARWRELPQAADGWRQCWKLNLDTWIRGTKFCFSCCLRKYSHYDWFLSRFTGCGVSRLDSGQTPPNTGNNNNRLWWDQLTVIAFLERSSVRACLGTRDFALVFKQSMLDHYSDCHYILTTQISSNRKYM